MGTVRNIGRGYYSISTGDVRIGGDVDSAVEAAFEKVSSIPARDLNVILNRPQNIEDSKPQEAEPEATDE